MSFRIPSVLLTLILLTTSACSDRNTTTSDEGAHLGSVSFEVTGDANAIPHFQEGLLLLHSFEYEDAAVAFQSAQDADADFVMAYWGEAMTKNHPLWSAQYTDEATEILNRSGSTPERRLAKAQTEIERDFLQAVEILFGEGEKKERDQLYAAHMQSMHDRYPEHHEVAAFYALSMLGSTSEGRDEAIYEKGAVIAQGILDENPQHPGALHYLIHSYDDPGHASLALDAANKYSKVAADAGHALHMPSHIYIAMGMWDEVISSNIAAWEAGNKRAERKSLDNDARNYHALHWLMYGYLQKGEMEMAKIQLDKMMAYGSELPSKRARAYMTLMRAGYLVDSDEWTDAVAMQEIDDKELNISIRSINDFVEGMIAFRNEDQGALESAINGMQEQRSEEQKRMMQRGSAMCSGVNWTAQLPNQQDINHAHIMEMELQALRSMLADDLHQAEMWFNQATALEESTAFMFGPPTVVKPSPELYGEWLMSRAMHTEAKEQFDKTLERAPKRRNALKYVEQADPAI